MSHGVDGRKCVNINTDKIRAKGSSRKGLCHHPLNTFSETAHVSQEMTLILTPG